MTPAAIIVIILAFATQTDMSWWVDWTYRARPNAAPAVRVTTLPRTAKGLFLISVRMKKRRTHGAFQRREMCDTRGLRSAAHGNTPGGVQYCTTHNSMATLGRSNNQVNVQQVSHKYAMPMVPFGGKNNVLRPRSLGSPDMRVFAIYMYSMHTCIGNGTHT